MNIKSNIKKYYIFKFVGLLLFHLPIFLIYLKGYLSLTQIMIMEVFAAFIRIVLEVPSGSFADIVGRKHALALGSSFLVFGYILYLAAPRIGVIFLSPFILFIIARCSTETYRTFMSGADSAFLYDTLKEIKQQTQFKKIMGNANALGYIAMTVSAIMGGLLTKIDITVPYIANIIACTIALLVVLTFTEPKHFKKLKLSHYWKHQKESIKFVISHPKVRWITFYFTIVFTFIYIGAILYFQPYLKSIGVPLLYFGFIYAGLMTFSAIISKYCYKIENRIGEKNSLYVMIIALIAGFLLMGLITKTYGILFLFLIEFVMAYSTPVLDHYTHIHLKSKHRATVLSVRNLSSGIAMAIFSPLLGWVADIYSLSISLLCSAIIVFILSMIIMPFLKINKSINQYSSKTS